MPPRKKASPKKDAPPASKPAASRASGAKKVRSTAGNEKKKRAGPYKMPPPLPKGEILTDFRKSKWCLGTSVGKGGFGEIYTACPSGKSTDAAQYVIKIEPHENGPLFTELSFYTRIAKPERTPVHKLEYRTLHLYGEYHACAEMQVAVPWKQRHRWATKPNVVDWIKSHGLSYLSVPKFIASGSHDHGGTKFRFMVMERFGEDIERKFTAAGRVFSLSTVCYLALQLLEALEFLHASEYVHADVKGSNLLTGFGAGHAHEVYLVDYGLAYRYSPDGEHKQYKEDPRKAHDGTIEFTSIDAHKGVSPFRRSDLEILGYCLLQWACGRLPWEGVLQDKPKVAAMKIKYHGNAGGLLKACFGDISPPSCLKAYMEAVYQLGYTDKPNYDKLKELFSKQLKALGCHGDGRDSLDWIASGKPKAKAVAKTSPKGKGRFKKEVVEVEESGSERESNGEGEPPPKRKKRTRAVKTKAAYTEEGSDHEEDEASPTPPPTAKQKKVASGGGGGKKAHISQKRPANKKGKAKEKMAASESIPAMVYYPKQLGYENGEGSDSSYASGASVDSSEEEEWTPSAQKVSRKRKALDDEDSEEEWSPVKRKRVAKATKTKSRRTTAKKKC